MLDQAAPGGLIKYNPPLRRGSAPTACKTSNIFHENRLNGWAPYLASEVRHDKYR